MTVLASGTLGAGFTAFIVVLALVVAVVFLFRSMTKHLRKVPPTFERKDDVNRPPKDDEGA
jgi:hypothetical protein